MTKPLIGCDPELFIQDKNYQFVAACGILPGTKQNPHKVDGGAVQVDGLAFEFNIDPSQIEDIFEKNMKKVLSQMDEMIKKVNPDYKLVCLPFVYFDKDYFAALPDEAKILGCDPDYDVHGNQHVPPDDLSEAPFRTAAGHVHIGWTEGQQPHSSAHFDRCTGIAYQYQNDEFYKPKTMLEQKRVQYYGRPGHFRPKHYGIELRSPSNRWVAQETTRRKMFRMTQEKYVNMWG